MLDKIENIGSNFTYKPGGSAPGFEKLLNGAGSVRVSVHDSILFSPAAYFLSKINWHLKEISNPSKEKFLLDFNIEEFEFQTEVDFTSFSSELWHSYNIIKEFESAAVKNKTLVKISTFKNITNISEDIEVFNLNGLRKLFERILKLNSSESINEIQVSKDLLDGLRFNLVKEFNYINSALFILIEKLGNKKLNLVHTVSDSSSEHIIVEKITVVNGR